MRSLVQQSWLAAAFCLFVGSAPRAGAVLSYAVEAHDAPGSSTGAAAVALGVPDYHFVNDTGLGYGGDDADVFAPGESTVLVFPVPMYNIPGQPDLIVWAFVGGAGATDDAEVEVEVSSDGTHFTPAGSFHTADGRDPMKYPVPSESDSASVKQFTVEFGSADRITHVRLRNVAGTAEGLRLDAVEGLHPVTNARDAFEIRLEQYRDPATVGRFRVRLKNLAMPGGEGIRELRIWKPPDPIRLEVTTSALYAQYGQPGRLICVENCIPDSVEMSPQPSIPFSRHAWSLDGSTEAPAGTGLDPGRQAAHLRVDPENFDTDYDTAGLLRGFSFEVAFTDGMVESFDFDQDVLTGGEIGALYQKYEAAVPENSINGPEPAYFHEFVPEPSCVTAALAAAAALLLLRTRSAPFPA